MDNNRIATTNQGEKSLDAIINTKRSLELNKKNCEHFTLKELIFHKTLKYTIINKKRLSPQLKNGEDS